MVTLTREQFEELIRDLYGEYEDRSRTGALGEDIRAEFMEHYIKALGLPSDAYELARLVVYSS